MRKLKLLSVMLSGLFVSIGIAHAENVTVQGHIEAIKINNSGGSCHIEIKSDGSDHKMLHYNVTGIDCGKDNNPAYDLVSKAFFDNRPITASLIGKDSSYNIEGILIH